MARNLFELNVKEASLVPLKIFQGKKSKSKQVYFTWNIFLGS